MVLRVDVVIISGSIVIYYADICRKSDLLKTMMTVIVALDKDKLPVL